MASFSFPRAVIGFPNHLCPEFRRGLCLWVLLLVLLPWSGPVGRSQWATNTPAPASFEEIRQKAEAGEPAFQRLIANSYLMGDRVNADPVAAARWFRLAAEKNDALAQFALGLMYAEGKGVSSDLAEAVRWFRQAADQGVAEAQLNLGVCYAKGEGIMPDQAEAVRWYRQAAEQGDVQGQSRLGLACLEGIGVEKNDSEALKWLRRAAYQNDPVAQFFTGTLYYDGKGVSRDLAEAIKWYRRAAEQGYAEAQYWLGKVSLQGDGIGLAGTNAMQWLQQAAAQGHAGAQKLLVTMGQAGSLTHALASNSVPAAELTHALKTVLPAPDTERTAAVKHADAGMASARSGGGILGGRMDLALLLAVCAATTIMMMIALVGVFMLASFKHRISSLEQEIKETKNELGKANVTLSTMLHYVESRALANKRSDKTQIAPPAPT